ncbi:MAG: apolipoprotein N-acyltransferase [Candidatus Omnitrophica bacterium]|nr:apolipoprotein N-acyltransferase [Candidatus Omnitrophota bacterium]
MAVPLLFVLDGRHWRLRLLLGFCWGLLTYGLLLWWLIPITPAGYAVFVAALSFQGLIFALLMCGQRWPVVLSLLYIPSAWVLSEYVRNCLLGGFTWGLGYALSAQPAFIQPARFGGVYAVSWLMVFFAAALAWRIKRKGMAVLKDPPSWSLLLIPLAVWIMGSMMIALDVLPLDKPLRIALVQPNISHADKTNISLYSGNVSRHLVLSKKSVQAVHPDMIVWPETAFTDDILRDDSWRPRMEMAARNFKVYFVLGSALLSDDGHDLNAMLLLDPQGLWKDVYYKRHLVPFSEYLPSDPLSSLLAQAAGMKSYHFLSGQRAGLFHLTSPNVEVGTAICSEEAYPLLYRDLAAKGAGVMVTMLNDGWFMRPEALRLHASMAVFRAVETGRPLVRAANTGWSVGFDGRGKVLAAAPLQSAGWVAVDVHPGQGQTFYVKFGDVFVGLCLGFVIIMLMTQTMTKSGFFASGGVKKFIFWAVAGCFFLLNVPPVHAAAVAQRRLQQQKQMQAQAAAQYQQQMMAQQQAQQVAAYQQAQQVAAYQQAQQAAQQAAAQKAAAEYAAQKQAMEVAVAQKQAQQQQAAQAVAVAQQQAQQVAQYQQAVAYNNVAALNQYKQEQQLKVYQEAQTQAQLNGEIAQYAAYTAKRNALLRAQAADVQQAETEKQLLQYAAVQKTAVKKRAEQYTAAQAEMTRRALGKKAAADILAPASPNPEALPEDEALSPETTVDISDLWDALDHSSAPWVQILDQEIKLLTVAEYIDRFRKGGAVIRRPPGDYVKMVDSLVHANPDMLNAPFGNILRYAAVMEYDFGNGKNKDDLARQTLGDAMFQANRKRLEKR